MVALVLKSLEIQGFKSFADKTLLTFGDGITAVVGPNGSGKSNIADAIRWVLGEQSTKALRGGRMEDVIFGGAATRRPLGFAEVSLTFDNSARFLPFEADEVTVTRRYYRSGESDYLLNGSNVRLRDVCELFMDTGLGRDGYSIIGQGRIAEIVSAKSEDRREIFEEAAGISKFRFKKEESERRLASAQQDIVRLQDIRGELGQRVGPLQKQAEKAREFLSMSQEKKSLETGLWVLELDRKRAQLRDNQTKLDLSQAQYDGFGAKIAELEKKLEAACDEGQKKAAEAEDRRREATALQEQAMQRQTAAELLRNDIAHDTETAAGLRGERDDLSRRGDETGAQLAARRGALASKRAERDKLDHELALCRAGLDGLVKQSEQFAGRLSESAGSLEALTKTLSAATLQKHEAELQLRALEQRGQTVGREIAEAQAALDAAGRELDDVRKAGEKNGARIEELNNALAGYGLKLKGRREKLAAFERDERALSLQISEKTQRAAMLQDLERHLEGFAHSVRLVVSESARGTLRGIRGPLSRLIRVPERWATAAETALGGALQDIVTDDEESAKAAIGLLKRERGGRCTFLPLSSVRGRVADGTFNGFDGFLGVLSELVGCDDRYRGVVRSLLGRTLLCRDLDAAVAMARRQGYRYRIVTLDGQLVNAGGSMTGGSRTPNAGLLSRAGEIRRLNAEAQALRQKLQTLSEGKKALEAEASALEASAAGARGELSTAQEERVRLAGEQKRLSGVAGERRRQIEARRKEQADAAGRREEFLSALSQAQRQIDDANRKTQALRDEIGRLGGGRDELEKRRDEQKARETKLQLDRMSADKDIERQQQGIAELERALSDRDARLEELGGRIGALEKRIADARTGIEQRKNEAAALRGRASEKLASAQSLSEARAALEQQTTGLRRQQRSLSDDKEKVSGELARLEERRAAAQSDYDAVVARLWDEYRMTRSQAEPYAAAIADPQQARRRLGELKGRIRTLGSVNVAAIDEYKEVSQRYEFLSRQVEDLEKSRDELHALIDGLTARMRTIFSDRFEEINRNFSRTFVELFGGGRACLRLTEPGDVLTSGIEINVQPPGKIIKNLSALSGGEQAFVAIALYFAILKVRPSPFCVLDEIEAALDDANVARFSDYLRRMCLHTQFIVITHRRGTMDGADRLYGVTMQEEGVSRLLTLDVDELSEKLGIA